MDIAPIKNRRDYLSALNEIAALMTAGWNTPEGERFDSLIAVVAQWESEHASFALGAKAAAPASTIHA